MNPRLISALKKIVAAPIIEIPAKEYQREITKYFGGSPELIDQLNREEKNYKKLGGTEHCISTNNVMFRYRENELKKYIFIIGIVSKSGRIEPKDLLDVREVHSQFINKLLNGWIIIASVNSNSKRMIDRIKQVVTTKGKKVYERSLGTSQWLDKPEFTFNTIVLGIDEEMLDSFEV
jgi:hypothetical protein